MPNRKHPKLVKGFISYSHDDYVRCEEFRTHMKAVERAFSVEIWADKRMRGGTRWNKSIEDAIALSDFFILLLSPDFIESDYIFDVEIPAIGSRYSAGALVLPVVLKRCYWQMVASALNAIPMHSGRTKPIIEWNPHNHGYDAARQQIVDAIGSHFATRPKTIDWSRS